jgi:hypothetical protein
VKGLREADERVRERLLETAQEDAAHEKALTDRQADLAATLARGQLPD